VLFRSVKLPADSWAQNINSESLEGKGEHEFSYTVFIESAARSEADLISDGISLRTPPHVLEPLFTAGSKKPILPLYKSFISINQPNIELTTVYFQKNGIIVRLWESNGEKRIVTLILPFTVKKARAEDFIGRVDRAKKIKTAKNKLRFTINPHEIVTLKLSAGKWAGRR
jgi:alpha-mannosidase